MDPQLCQISRQICTERKTPSKSLVKFMRLPEFALARAVAAEIDDGLAVLVSVLAITTQ